jgi:hypothetical protein
LRASFTRRSYGRKIVIVGLAVGCPVVAQAQISSLFLEEWDLEFGFSRTSARLAAMGDAAVGVEDESAEIGMWDYGRNVAGFLDDRDAWTGDFWGAATNRNRRTSGLPSSGENAEGGIQISFRSYQRALGLEFNLTRSTFEDGVGIGFERHKFSGPTVSFVGNQTVGDKLVLGGALTLIDEEDEVTAPNALSIAHSSNRTNYSFGAVYYLLDDLSLGGSLLLGKNPVRGVSENALHRDVYEWDRPATEFGLQAVYGEGKDLQGAVYLSRHLLDGGEVVEVSWAREFLFNPSGIDLSLRVPVLNEEFKEVEIGSRWLYRLGRRFNLGAQVQYNDGSYDVDADPTWSSFLSSRNDDFTDTRISVGVGVRPHERVLLAGQLASRTRDTQRLVFENRFDLKDERGSVNLGIEYFWVSNLILRGGYVIGTETTESTLRGQAGDTTTREEFDRNRVTGGIGWTPLGGIFQIDVAFALADGEATSPITLSDRTDGLSFAVSGRTILK